MRNYTFELGWGKPFGDQGQALIERFGKILENFKSEELKPEAISLKREGGALSLVVQSEDVHSAWLKIYEIEKRVNTVNLPIEKIILAE